MGCSLAPWLLLPVLIIKFDEDGSSITLPARSESLFLGLVVVPQLRNTSSRRRMRWRCGETVSNPRNPLVRAPSSSHNPIATLESISVAVPWIPRMSWIEFLRLTPISKAAPTAPRRSLLRSGNVGLVYLLIWSRLMGLIYKR